MGSTITGNLKSWNADRGFGFITPLNGGQDIFVHISDYPKRSGPPKVGEMLNFEVALSNDGKKKAINVQRPGTSQPRSPDTFRPARPIAPNERASARQWPPSCCFPPWQPATSI